MRYHYEDSVEYRKREEGPIVQQLYSTTYMCNHPLYDRCTLYTIRGKGLAVVQQNYNSALKATFWEPLDPELANAIYTHKKFLSLFQKYAAPEDEDHFYPTIPVRKVMWELRMPPLRKQRWETTFDRRFL